MKKSSSRPASLAGANGSGALRCPHGYQPQGWWQGPDNKRTYQVSLPCCMWYPVVKDEAAAQKAFAEFVSQNTQAQTPGENHP